MTFTSVSHTGSAINHKQKCTHQDLHHSLLQQLEYAQSMVKMALSHSTYEIPKQSMHQYLSLLDDVLDAAIKLQTMIERLP